MNSPFLLLIGALALGKALSFLLGRRARVTARVFNRWVIWIALPSLIFIKIQSLTEIHLSSPDVWLPISLPWLHWILVIAILTGLKRFLGWSHTVWGAMVLTVGLGNTSFVGFPLLRAILGEDAIVTGVLLDQLGSFLILSLVAAPLAVVLSPRASKVSRRALAWRAVSFPPFVALVLAFLLRESSIPEGVVSALSTLSTTLAPAALLSVGLSSSLSALKKKEVRTPLVIGVTLKLLLLPVLYFVIYPRLAQAAGSVSHLVLQATLLEGCMASMITAGVIAAENGFEPELAQLMVSVSVLLSLVTVPIWGFLMRSLITI